MLSFGVNLHEIEAALQKSNSNVTGGYLDGQGPNEFLVRSLGRIQSVEDLRKLVVKIRSGRPVLLAQVANVIEGPEVKRGDSSAFVRQEDGKFAGGPCVILTVNKQPGTDTRQLTERVTDALEELKASLPPDIRIAPELYQQKQFIDLAIDNVMAALRDGGILVAIILFVFLLNFRTTFITLTAIPLSIVVTGLVFKWFDMSINTMTLGGLAVAIGELVDDAIVDVENIFRRLRENRQSAKPKPPLLVVFQASAEIRNSIVFSTLIIVLVFIPLFALSGMEGRLFTPLGVAYIVSILASLVVSLTVTPVLSYWLLPNSRVTHREKESFVLRGLKWLAAKVIGLSLRMPKPVLVAAVVAVVVSGIAMSRMQSDFMPPFDEGVAQLNVLLPPGTSLQRSKEVATMVERRLQKIQGVEGFVARTGRAELDEHIIGVNMSEFIISFDPKSGRSREEVLDEIREAMADIPGIVTSVEQPMAHLISAMLSGVQAQVAIKLYGDDLDVLRAKVKEMQKIVAGVPGVKDLVPEPQISIPQLRIELNRDQLARYGLTPGDVNEFIETAMHGRVVSEVLQGQRTFDLFVRLDERYRENLDALSRMSLDLPEGGTTPLSSVAKIYQAGGPNTINREQVRRRIVLQCNTAGRGLVDVVRDIQDAAQARSRVAAHRLLHRVRRAVPKPTNGLADDRRAVLLVAGRDVSGAVHDVPFGQLLAPGDGRAADGLHRRGGGDHRDRPDAHHCQHGGIHFLVRHRHAKRHPAAGPLSASREIRGRNMVPPDDYSGRTGAAGPRADDRSDGRHRIGALWRWPPVSRARKSFTRWPRSSSAG